MAVRSEVRAIMAERARGHFGLSEIPEPVATTELCALGVQIAIAASTAAQPNAATNSRDMTVDRMNR